MDTSKFRKSNIFQLNRAKLLKKKRHALFLVPLIIFKKKKDAARKCFKCSKRLRDILFTTSPSLSSWSIFFQNIEYVFQSVHSCCFKLISEETTSTCSGRTVIRRPTITIETEVRRDNESKKEFDPLENISMKSDVAQQVIFLIPLFFRSFHQRA